jgi:hypothetical protein
MLIKAAVPVRIVDGVSPAWALQRVGLNSAIGSGGSRFETGVGRQ